MTCSHHDAPICATPQPHYETTVLPRGVTIAAGDGQSTDCLPFCVFSRVRG